MDYNIRIEQHPGQPLAVVRRQAVPRDFSKVVPAACGAVWNVMKSQKVANPGRHVSVYLDDQNNLEIGVEVPTPFASFGEVIGSSTPAGRVVTTTHFGPYPGLRDAHAAIHRWCKANGHTPIRPMWEVYGHWKDDWNNDPSKIQTDIFYLLA